MDEGRAGGGERLSVMGGGLSIRRVVVGSISASAVISATDNGWLRTSANTTTCHAVLVSYITS